MVLLGLILVSFGPLNIFPKTKPPMSEAIQHNSIQNVNIFNCGKFVKKKNRKLIVKI